MMKKRAKLPELKSPEPRVREAKVDEERLLVLAPLGRDAALLCEMLAKVGFVCEPCQDALELALKLEVGAGVVLLTEEALNATTITLLSEVLTAQPAWSDLPIILLVNPQWQRPQGLGHDSVTLLERPTRLPTLTTVTGSLLRARLRQYQVRDLLAQQEHTNETLEGHVRERTAALKTSHAQTEAEHQQVTTILRCISDAFIALDHDYRFTHFNQKGEVLVKKVSGRRTAKLLGKTLWETFPNSEHNPSSENYRRALQEQVSVAFEEFFPDLKTWFEVHVYPSAEGLVAYFQDITGRKEVETSLRSSEERFAKAFRANPVAGCLMTLPGERFLDANESFRHLTGYSREELIGRSSYDIGLWISKITPSKIQEALYKDGHYRDLTLQLKTKTGEVRDILASAEVMELDSAAVILHMFYDVTNQKRSEQELMEAIETVMQDTAWFSRSVVEKLAQVRAKKLGGEHEVEVAELSKREKQVLSHIATGHDDAYIATDLGLAKQTIRNYISNIYEKLGIHSRAEAVVWARERGLTDA
jgi:PAS domain S-box-containing protein